ncbi:MAG: hypothetical protein V4801_28075 [Burkholderia gladioli]
MFVATRGNRELAYFSARAGERPGFRAHALVARLTYVHLEPWTVLGHWSRNEAEAGRLDGIRLIEPIAHELD